MELLSTFAMLKTVKIPGLRLMGDTPDNCASTTDTLEAPVHAKGGDLDSRPAIPAGSGHEAESRFMARQSGKIRPTIHNSSAAAEETNANEDGKCGNDTGPTAKNTAKRNAKTAKDMTALLHALELRRVESTAASLWEAGTWNAMVVANKYG